MAILGLCANSVRKGFSEGAIVVCSDQGRLVVVCPLLPYIVSVKPEQWQGCRPNYQQASQPGNKWVPAYPKGAD